MNTGMIGTVSRVVGILGIALATATSFAQTPSFSGLGAGSRAYGISGNGSVVVGSITNANGEQAFSWTLAGGSTGLGYLPGAWMNFSRAYGASSDGSVIVGTSESAIFGARPFQTTEGSAMSELLGTQYGWAAATSGDGSVTVGTNMMTGYHFAFRSTQAGMLPLSYLGSMPGPLDETWSEASGVSVNGSIVVGESTSSSGYQAFRWTEAGGMVGLGDLSGGDFSSAAKAISADGSVIVGHGTSASGQEAFRWTQAGDMVGLGDLSGGSFSSEAVAASADGSIIVGQGTSDLGSDAFIWDSANGMRSLKDVLADMGLNMTGWTSLYATGISGDGQTIVGYGTNSLGQVEGWVATVPEPATLSLLALGGLAVLKRRK